MRWPTCSYMLPCLSLLGSNLRVANHSVADSSKSLSPVSTLDCQQACVPNKSQHAPMALSEISLSRCNPAVQTWLRTQLVPQRLAFPEQQADQHIIMKVITPCCNVQPAAGSITHASRACGHGPMQGHCLNRYPMFLLRNVIALHESPTCCVPAPLLRPGWPHTTPSSVGVEQHWCQKETTAASPRLAN